MIGLNRTAERNTLAPRKPKCSGGVLPRLQERAVSVLRTVMKESKAFENVHAAETLMWSGRPEGVKEYFSEQDRLVGPDPRCRVGNWRVLYWANVGSPTAQAEYFQRIAAVFCDDTAPDCGWAAESLCKLGYAGGTPRVLDLAQRGQGPVRVSARWMLANSGDAEDEARLAELLRSANASDRYYSAYAFRHFRTIRPHTLRLLRALAAEEPADGEVRCFVLGTLYTHLPVNEREPVKRELLGYADNGKTDQRYQACMAFANWPTEDMIPTAERLLSRLPLDEQVGGAYLLLRMSQPRAEMAAHHWNVNTRTSRVDGN
jgi:hypothetical protein